MDCEQGHGETRQTAARHVLATFAALVDQRVRALGLAIEARRARRAGVRHLAPLVLKGKIIALSEIVANGPSPQAPSLNQDLNGEPSAPLVSGRIGPPHDVSAYRDWIAAHEPDPEADAQIARAWLEQRKIITEFSIVMATYQAEPEWLDRAVGTLIAQAYPRWRLIIVDDASPDPASLAAVMAQAARDPRIEVLQRTANGGISAATNEAIARADGDWVVFMDHDDMLSRDALAVVAAAISDNPNAELVYTDEDKIDDEDHRSDPYFKGGFDRQLLYGQNYLNHLTAVRADLLRRVGPLRSDLDGSQDYDLILRCVEASADDAIVHAPFVCYHWRHSQRRASFSQVHGIRATNAARTALSEHLARVGIAAAVDAAWDGSGYHRATPSRAFFSSLGDGVSVVVEVKNFLEVAERTIASLSDLPTDMACEILLIDASGGDSRIREGLEGAARRHGARLVTASDPRNSAQSRNDAARSAVGDFIAFVDGDLEPTSSDWLAELLYPFARSDVWAVGPKIISPDGNFSQTGLVVGMSGGAASPYSTLHGGEGGPSGRLKLAREVSAVSAQCMVVRRAAFEGVGAFEEDLGASLFGVDLCLKLRRAGGRTVWTPTAEFIHRDADDDANGTLNAQAIGVLRQRWAKTFEHDPYWSPNLDICDVQGLLAWPPRARRPWSMLPTKATSRRGKAADSGDERGDVSINKHGKDQDAERSGFDSLLERGDAARDARRWAEAHAHYAAALALRPDAAGIWVQNGHALKESGDLAGAEAAYRAALKLEPDNGDTHLQLGHVVKMQDRPAEAVAAYLSAQRLMPGSPDPARELAHQGASAAQGREVGHNQDLLRSLMIELRAARERLDRIEASLPSIEALTAFAPADYATFREFYRTPPPLDAGRLACRALIIADLSGMRLPQARAVCQGLRAQRHPLWRAVVIGADPACASLVRQYAALDARIAIVESQRSDGFYPAAKAASAAVDDFAPDWIVLTPPGFALAEHALDWLLTRPSAEIAMTFGDADALVGDAPATARRIAPVFRSGFDLDLAVQADVTGACVTVRADVWRAFDAGDASDHALMRLLPIHAARSGIVRHVPFVVATQVAGYHGGLGLEAPIAWPAGEAPAAAALAERLAAAAGLSDVGFEADPLAASAPPQMVRRTRRCEAIIEVVIPTRDRLDLLRPCVESLEARARGGVIATIVDNGSREPETLDWLSARRRSGGRVLEIAEPFNWSRLNNLAAAQSAADILLFLNNDTVMLTQDWDDRLRGQIDRAQVGAVGARLLYPDLTIQHAGVVAGFEDSVVHEGVGAPAAERGACGRWAHARAVGAVTGAFLAVERRRFSDAGGFDERDLMVAFSDIDLCFKLRAAGLSIMYEPAISLIHHESKSRGHAHVRRESLEREKVEKHISATRWAHALAADPALNPHWNRWGRPMATIRSPSTAAVDAYLRLTGSANPWLLDPPRET